MGATTRRGGSGRKTTSARRRPPPRRRLAPSARTLVGLLALAGALLGGYLAASRSSLFALRAVEVRGGSAAVAAQVRAALQPFLGDSLVRLDRSAVVQRLESLPVVSRATYDRAFPHTLRVDVRSERPVAVLRQGAESWLVSVRGRVMRRLPHPRRSSLPRIWVPKTTPVEAGRILGVAEGGRAARALAALRREPLPTGVRSARADAQSLSFVLGSGVDLRLGSPRELQLKLAIARRILGSHEPFAYLDVSVPERPVAGMKAQVEG